MLLISGGDRHGVEPNANINLTNATSALPNSCTKSAANARSNVLFMPQYAEPWKHRLLQSTLDAIRDYPDFPQGSRSWDERVLPSGRERSHPAAVRTVAQGISTTVHARHNGLVQMMGNGPVSGGLRMAWNDSQQIRLALGEHEVSERRVSAMS